MLKNKQLIIIGGIVVIVGIAGFLLLTPKNNQQPQSITPKQSSPEDSVATLDPAKIGLEFTQRDDKKAVKFVINKPDNIASVEYTISYTAQSKEGQSVPQGLIGDAIVDPSSNKIEIAYRELGTCSSGVCRYDTVISPITLTLKITNKDNKIYQVTSILPQ